MISLLDEALAGEHFSQGDLQLGRRQADPLVARRHGVADAGEHIGDRVGQGHDVPS